MSDEEKPSRIDSDESAPGADRVENSSGADGAENSPADAANASGIVDASGGGPRTRNLPYEQARLAYTIIQALLEHTQVTQDLVALMAQTIDEDTQNALVNTPHWAAYLDSRRVMERTRADVERFAEVWTRMAEEFESPPDS